MLFLIADNSIKCISMMSGYLFNLYLNNYCVMIFPSLFIVCNLISHDKCLLEARKIDCSVRNGEYTSLNCTTRKDCVKKDPLTAAVSTGHEFKVKSFYKPTYCHHCSELLWGLMNQGYQCTGNNNQSLLLLPSVHY